MNLQYSGSDDYIVSDDLKNSVNIAITLQKPLLIKGEPGTGKTMLAEVREARPKEELPLKAAKQPKREIQSKSVG